jgi:cytidylate kinase
MKRIRIAIDGPAGAGKSSVSMLVAEKLGYSYIDTGAIYRSVAYAMVEKNVKIEEEDKIRDILKDFDVSFKMIDGLNHVYLNGEDITSFIRTEKVSMLASTSSALPFVREALFELQKQFGRQGGVVMEGRDIGTVIMPDAELKIFLTASPKNRAQRRLGDLEKKGVNISLEELIEEIKKRDKQDSERKIAPLKQADDAVLLDNTELNLAQTADFIVDKAQEIVEN